MAGRNVSAAYSRKEGQRPLNPNAKPFDAPAAKEKINVGSLIERAKKVESLRVDHSVTLAEFENPVTFPCGHTHEKTTHEALITKCAEGQVPCCPDCRAPIGVVPKTNILLKDFFEETKSLAGTVEEAFRSAKETLKIEHSRFFAETKKQLTDLKEGLERAHKQLADEKKIFDEALQTALANQKRDFEIALKTKLDAQAAQSISDKKTAVTVAVSQLKGANTALERKLARRNKELAEAISQKEAAIRQASQAEAKYAAQAAEMKALQAEMEALRAAQHSPQTPASPTALSDATAARAEATAAAASIPPLPVDLPPAASQASIIHHLIPVAAKFDGIPAATSNTSSAVATPSTALATLSAGTPSSSKTSKKNSDDEHLSRRLLREKAHQLYEQVKTKFQASVYTNESWELVNEVLRLHKEELDLLTIEQPTNAQKRTLHKILKEYSILRRVKIFYDSLKKTPCEQVLDQCRSLSTDIEKYSITESAQNLFGNRFFCNSLWNRG